MTQANRGRVVVVGSGPAGACAARFLARAGADVLLLEAGAESTAGGLTVRVGGFTVLKSRRPLGQRTGVRATGDPDAQLFEDLAPGGLTNHWSCAVPRFAPEDFEDAARAGEAFAWPIGYDDLAPWYDRVEPLLHIAGGARSQPQLPAAKVRRARELGADWTPLAAAARHLGRTIVPMPYAYGADTGVTRSGTVFNSFVRILRPEIRAGRVAARFDARVLSLEYAPATRRVERIVVRDARTGGIDRIDCRAVVLAAGSIGTAEILLASSSADFPRGLGNSDDVLGKYLHDHPLGKLAIDLGAPIAVLPPSYLTRPTLDRAPPLYAAACVQWTGTDMLARSILSGRPGRLPWLGFNVFATMAPSPENFVALDPARRDGAGGAGLILHVRHPPEARTALERAKDDVVDVLARTGWAPRVRGWHVEPVGNAKHYAGTCRMHASRRFGMLDAWSRLHDVRNVAVADSAAFTTGPEKNPVLTAMALAARAGSRLADELASGDV